MRFILKLLSRKDTLQLWQKLHSLFALKLEIADQGQATVEPVTVTDIQEMFFKVDTYYLTEASAIEYAMSKLEAAKKETMETFEKLIADARKISNSGYEDTGLTETNAGMTQNVDKILESKATYESEMQGRFQKLVENQRKLNFKKIKLLEDLDFMLRDQMHDLTEDSQHKQTPAPVQLEPPTAKPQKAVQYKSMKPVLQFFEELDPVKK